MNHFRKKLIDRYRLSEKQARIVDLAVQGLSRPQIALSMGVRYSTMKSYTNTIYRLTETKNHVDLVAKFEKIKQEWKMENDRSS